MDNQDRKSLSSGASPQAIADDLEALVHFREKGLTLEEISGLIQERLLPHLMDYGLPEFQSFFNAFPEPGAEFGARIALKYNQWVTNFYCAPRISADDYAFLAGWSGHDFPEGDVAASGRAAAQMMVQNALLFMISRYREKNKTPAVAVLREGPYGIPCLRN